MTNPKEVKCCEGACVNFKGCLDKRGYGRLTVKGVQFKAHVLAVLLSGRKIPKGLVCDHVCRNTSCINPDHIRVVTNAENVMAGESFGPKNKAKTICSKGHSFSGKNLGIRKSPRSGNPERFCKTCKLANKRDKRLRDKANKI